MTEQKKDDDDIRDGVKWINGRPAYGTHDLTLEFVKFMLRDYDRNSPGCVLTRNVYRMEWLLANPQDYSTPELEAELREQIEKQRFRAAQLAMLEAAGIYDDSGLEDINDPMKASK